MKRSRQNQIPPEFKSFYTPQLTLKKLLQSGKSHIDETHNEAVIIGLAILHYATFFVSALYRLEQITNERTAYIRTILENVLAGNEYQIQQDEIAKIVSFIDLVGKLINTTAKLKIHIAMYEGYLDYEIYSHFHEDKPIFEFKYFCIIGPDVVERMKEYSEASRVLLNLQDS
jgi:hypothetical protein